jgi:hypothetical protein
MKRKGLIGGNKKAPPFGRDDKQGNSIISRHCDTPRRTIILMCGVKQSFLFPDSNITDCFGSGLVMTKTVR